MTAVQATAIVLWLGVTLYAVFGGADFGAGFWDFAAGGSVRGLRPRALIADAIGPVWEANHTWLIFDLVILWTAFPPAFASIMSTLFIPLSLVALGMVLRGAAFAFRPVATGLRGRRAAGADLRRQLDRHAVLPRGGRRRHRERPGPGGQRGRATRGRAGSTRPRC